MEKLIPSVCSIAMNNFFTMRSSTLLCHLLLAIFPTFPCANGDRFSNLPHAMFYNPPAHDGEHSSQTTTVKPLSTATAPTPNVTSPAGSVACLPALESFVLTHAAISACPLCPQMGIETPTNQSNQTMHNSQQSTMESFNVTFSNPDPRAADITCRLNWDTSAASPNKFPVAKQMDCDKDVHNQLYAVVEKQASGVASGFYLFVWNK